MQRTIDAFTPAEFDALVALPEAAGVDPVRGPAAFTSIIDHRGDERRQIDRAEGRPLLLPPEPLVSASARQTRLVIGGWILGGCIVAALAELRIRRGNGSMSAGISPRTRAEKPRGAEPGMTLVETILVVALLGVLVALLAPVLRSESEAGRAAGTLSNLRQHGAIMAAYGADQRDAVPCVTNPRATQSIVRCRSAGVTLTVGYFSGANFWYLGLADAYYDGALYIPSFRSPLATSAAVGCYIMPCSYLADPEYYNPLTRREPPLQFRGTAFPEVLWPAKKSLVVDIAESARAGQYGPRMASAAMADGHAVRLRATDPLPQYANGDGAIHPQFAPDWPAIEPMTHTLDGVRGRDLP